MLRTYTDLELRVREFGRTVRRHEEGASMVEYALLVALIAVIVLAALGPLGEAISSLFDGVTDDVNGAG